MSDITWVNFSVVSFLDEKFISVYHLTARLQQGHKSATISPKKTLKITEINQVIEKK